LITFIFLPSPKTVRDLQASGTQPGTTARPQG
jgi:hypothetical protein